jgi:hypothetical protein
MRVLRGEDADERGQDSQRHDEETHLRGTCEDEECKYARAVHHLLRRAARGARCARRG